MAEDSEKAGSELAEVGNDTIQASPVAEDVFTPVPVFPRLPPLSPTSLDSLELENGSGATEPGETTRLGLRFAPNPNPVLISLFPDPGTRYDLELDRTMIVGRDPKRCDLVLFNASVSSKHCQIEADDDVCSIVDLGSSNGTYVNGERLKEPKTLRQGDLITIGRHVLIFVWHKFAKNSRTEAIHYRELKALMAQLYSSPASVQTLLLASNLFHLPVDLTRGTIEAVWERVLEALRKADTLQALDLMVTCALRDHPSSRELLKIREALLAWKSSRQEVGLQDRIMAEVKNSAYVVREIIENHMGSEEQSQTTSELLEEDSLEIEAVKPIHLRSGIRDDRVAAPPRSAPAELPFDLQNEPLTASLTTDLPRLEGLEDADLRAPAPVVAEAPPAPVPPPVPAPARIPEPPPVQAHSEPAPQREIPELESRRSASGPEENKGAAPPPQPASTRSNLDGGSSKVAESGEQMASPSSQKAPWEDEVPKKVSWKVVAGVAAAVTMIGLGIVLGSGVLGTRGENGKTTSVEAPPVAEPGEVKKDPAAPSTGEEDPKAAASAGTGSTGEKAPPAEATEVKKAPEEPVVRGTPAKPVFVVINFLGDDEKPKYTADSIPEGTKWDAKTSQISAQSLSECRWNGGEKKFVTKGGKMFYFVTCKAGSGQVEGWVNQAAMKVEE